MAARKVVVTDYTFPALEAEARAAETAGATFESRQCRNADEVVAAVRDADIAVVQFAPLTAAAIAGLRSGAAVIRYGIGYDNVDVEAARHRGIPVGYVPDYCTEEVADHTVALILAQLRKLARLDASVRDGRWAAVAVAEPIKPYRETTIGFLGLGQIGRAVLERLRPSGFAFVVSDPMLDGAGAAALGVTLLDPESLVAAADVLTLHALLTAATRAFVNTERLSRMRPGAIVINTARGALVDEGAVAAAATAGQIGGAALDVFSAEPLAADSPLRSAPGVLLTPHAAWYSTGAITRLQTLVAADIAAHLDGRPLRKPVPGSAA